MQYEDSSFSTDEGVAANTSNRNEPDSVDVRSRNMQIWLDRSLLPRTLLGGTYAMREASTVFLPKNPLETDKSYKRRLAGSTLLNAYKKTVSFLAGMVFQRDLVFSDEVQEEFKEWAKNIDSKDNSLDVFGKRTFQEGLGKGVNGIFVDMPIKPEFVKTKADEKTLNLRPYFKRIKPEDVLGGIIDESGELIQVRIIESKVVRSGLYGTNTTIRIRVIEKGKWSLHEVGDQGKTTEIESGEYSINTLPFVPFIPGEEWTNLTGESPLMDLAELNAKHWRTSSDQDNILSVARVPLLFGRKIDLEKLPDGVATMINSDADDSTLEYVEHSGAAIAAGEVDVKGVETLMALYGLQQLVPRIGNMTATEKKLTSSESNSSLGTWSTEFDTVLNKAFQIAAEFMGMEFPDNGITSNKEYNLGVVDPQELQAILKMEEQGILTPSAAFDEIRRRGSIDEHLSWDDMEEEREEEERKNTDLMNMFGSKGEGDGETDPNKNKGKGDEDKGKGSGK